MIKRNLDFCGWYIPELKDSNPDLSITIITSGTNDAECHDVTFITTIFQNTSVNTDRRIPKIIYSGSVKAGVAAHYWATRAYIFQESKAEKLLRLADGNSNEENRPDLIAMTPAEYLDAKLQSKK